MYNPSLQALLVQARVQELQRSRQPFACSPISTEGRSALHRPKISPLSTFIRRHVAGRGRLRPRNA